MKMIALLFTLLSVSAYSAEIKVLDLPAGGLMYQSSTFEVNRELGRAWVEVSIKDTLEHERGYRGETYRKLVEGLSFDGAKVRLDHEGQMFECANVVQRGRSIFRYNQVTKTGCDFVKREAIVLRDTGFEVIKERRLQVFLITK
jgi:hypothetical protein